MKKKNLIRGSIIQMIFVTFCVFMFSCGAKAQKIDIVSDKKSNYTIVIPSQPNKSLVSAAEEFVLCVKEATGATLPIVNESKLTNGPKISLGNTKLAKEQGFDLDGLKDDGFIIATVGVDIYIVGKDSPDNKFTKLGGKSYGTSNGVYTFLEDYLGMRWLLPGKIGRDVPKIQAFSINPVNRTDNPRFMYRMLTYLTSSFGPRGEPLRHVRNWEANQKLGFSINLSYSHSWRQLVPPSLFKTHPEWFAMENGKRIKPTRNDYKIETTNQELIRYIANKAIDSLKKASRWQTFSISPNDNYGWSQSPESIKLLDPETPQGKVGVSSLILKYYNDVASVVNERYPEGKLAGYIYSSYIYPPKKYEMKLPDNFIPVIAPSFNYGFRLYRNDVKREFNTVMDGWAKLAPETWIYFDIPNQFMRYDLPLTQAGFAGNSGVITPSSVENLEVIFSKLVESNIDGAFIYGSPAWGNAGLNNYVLAKLLWDPTLNPATLQRDWLLRAYGEEAGEVMISFYDKLDDLMKDYYNKNSSASFVLTDEILENFYGRNYKTIESLFLKTKGFTLTSIQSRRLKLIEDNLKVLQWRLKNAGFLSRSYTSPLSVDDNQINIIIKSSFDGVSVIPEAIEGNRDQFTLPKVNISSIISNKKIVSSQVVDADSLKKSKVIQNLSENTFIVSSPYDTKINMTTLSVVHGGAFATFEIRNSKGELVNSGLLSPDISVEFAVKKNTPYYVYIPIRNRTSCELSFKTNQSSGAGTLKKAGENPVVKSNIPLVVIAPKKALSKTNGADAVILTSGK